MVVDIASTATQPETAAQHNAPVENVVEEIALHTLCQNCTTFFEQWEPLQWFQMPERSTEWPYSSYLCTVTQLIEDQQHCHFCKLLLASLDRSRFVERKDVLDMNVWLRFEDKDTKMVTVVALFSEQQPLSAGDGKVFAFFVMERYEEHERGGFHEHFAAHHVPIHAQDNIARARGWINTCLQEHTACRDFQANTVDQTERPTRVLEIVSEQLVRLKCDMATSEYNYLALSHMWGKNQKYQIRLVQSKLQDFQANIPWDQLSDIYREAIRITRELGYRYLWIDSLCIIQDSSDDWDYESRRMSIVYGNCVCNIAYLFPPGGAPRPRDDPRTWNPCIIQLATTSQCGAYVRHPSDQWRLAIPEEKQDWLIQRDWPLFSRAWTFQEYLLAPRTLLYGHKNLMFQCSKLFYDELLGPVAEGIHTSTKGRDMCKTRYFPAVQSVPDSLSSLPSLRFLLAWTSLLDEYRARNLTFTSDRVVAFAGIAASYHTLSSLTYLAGLWWEYVPLSLLWFVEPKLPALIRMHYPEHPRGEGIDYTDEITEPGVATAPSWSWFSAPIRKYWCASCVLNNDEPTIRERSAREPMRSAWQDVYWAQPISYHSFSEQDDSNTSTHPSFSNFSGLTITLNTLLWPVKHDLPANFATHMRNIRASHPLDRELDWIPKFTYYPDTPCALIPDFEYNAGVSLPSAATRSPPRNALFALLAEFQIVRTGGGFHIQRRMTGLVLVPGQRKDTWRRVGAWYLKIRIRGVAVELGDVSDVGERWKRYSLTSDWSAETLRLV